MVAELTHLPGNPTALGEKAAQLAASAVRMQSAIDNLNKLADRDETVSEAVDALRERTHDVAASVTRARTRYRDTAEALQDYAPLLDAAQHRADAAILAYNNAVDSVSTAQNHLATARQHYVSEAAPDGAISTMLSQTRFDQSPAGARAAQAVQDAQDAVDAARKEWWAALADMHDAAASAIGRINDAFTESGLDDTFWEKAGQILGDVGGAVGTWLHKHLGPFLDALQKIAATIANIAGTLALVFTVLGVFFPALEGVAGVLEAISMISSAASFVLTLGLALLGDRTAGDVLSTGIVAVVSVLTFGVLGGKLDAAADGLGGLMKGTRVGTAVAKKAGAATARLTGRQVAAQGASHEVTSFVSRVVYRQVSTDLMPAVGKVVINGGTDMITDNVATNVGSARDRIYDDRRPDGLWSAPPSLTPEFNAFGAEGPEGGLGALDPVGYTEGMAGSLSTIGPHIVGAHVQTCTAPGGTDR